MINDYCVEKRVPPPIFIEIKKAGWVEVFGILVAYAPYFYFLEYTPQIIEYSILPASCFLQRGESLLYQNGIMFLSLHLGISSVFTEELFQTPSLYCSPTDSDNSITH